MANEAHLAILKKSVEGWNGWRKENPEVLPDLSKANLSEANLEHADFSGTVLTGAKLTKANLEGATLQRANLSNASLREARGLSEEQLAGANLSGAKLPAGIGTFKQQLSDVEGMTKSLDFLFFWVLLACLYSLLTIASTTHTQLVTNAASSPLPVIQTQIPIALFYLTAPFLLLCMYGYFHLYLQRLWEMLAALPAVFPDGQRLDKKIYPRSVNGFVRRRCLRLKEEGSYWLCLPAEICIVLIWFAVPVNLFIFWWTYLLRHEWFGALWLVLLTVVSLVLGLLFYRRAVTSLQQRTDEFPTLDWGTFGVGVFVFSVLLLLRMGTFPFSDCHTTGADASGAYAPKRHPFRDVLCSAVADLTSADVSTKPSNWEEPGEHGPVNDASAWERVREQLKKKLGVIKGASLGRSDLRSVEATRAFLINSDLRRAKMQGANLWGADLRQARLLEAQLQNATLRYAKLTLADLRGADLWRADLLGADLQGVSLSMFDDECYNVIPRKGDLTEANFTAAYLMWADLKGAHLPKARLRQADLRWVSLQGANLREADLQEAKLQGADLSAAAISVRCDDEHTELAFQQVSFKTINLPGADLWKAKLQRANLRGANLRGANLRGADLQGADLGGANLLEADLQGADLREVRNLTTEQLVKVKTLNIAQLDPSLREQIQKESPSLLNVEVPRETSGFNSSYASYQSSMIERGKRISGE